MNLTPADLEAIRAIVREEVTALLPDPISQAEIGRAIRLAQESWARVNL